MTPATNFLKDQCSYSLSEGLLAVTGWVSSRVTSVNLAILENKHLRCVNAGHAAPWDRLLLRISPTTFSAPCTALQTFETITDDAAIIYRLN
jgi:hypothetical protein